MIIVRQDRNVFYNWDNVVCIYIGQVSKTEILLDSTTTVQESLGCYKNEENAKAAFKRLVENILEKALYAIVPTDEEIESSIHQGTESSSEEEQQLKNI